MKAKTIKSIRTKPGQVVFILLLTAGLITMGDRALQGQPVSPFKITFGSDRDAPGVSGEVYVMKADGTGQTRLTSNAAQDDVPAFSLDGKRIAFQTERPLLT